MRMMKRMLFPLLTLACCTPWVACDRNFGVLPVPSIHRELTPLEKALTRSDNAFGIALFKEIVRAEKDKNVFVSPFSVAMALGMTLNGAAGATETAMTNTLGFAGMTREEINAAFKSLMDLLPNLDPDVRFQTANSIWYRLGFAVEPEFIRVNRLFNGWVYQKTNGKITKIIDRISPDMAMFLINAITFKGNWTYRFDPTRTQDGRFTRPDGKDVACRLMGQEADLSYADTEAFQAVDLTYGDGTFGMTVFLPKSGRSLDGMIQDLSGDGLDAACSGLRKTKLTLEMPKFKLEYEIKLNDVLSALGMGVAFTESADFSRIRKSGGLAIDEVKHKTFVEVNEEGTEAAAVTVVGIIETSLGPVMRVNRPYFFVIREKESGTILFMGKIVEPVPG